MCIPVVQAAGVDGHLLAAEVGERVGRALRRPNA